MANKYAQVLKWVAMAADEGPVSIPLESPTGPRSFLPRAGRFNGPVVSMRDGTVASRVSSWPYTS